MLRGVALVEGISREISKPCVFGVMPEGIPSMIRFDKGET
jgi:hypothetical protein